MKLSKKIDKSVNGAVLLLVWVICACIVPNVWLSITEPLEWVQSLANVLLPLGIYIFLMSLSRHIGRTSLWMITVLFFAAFQMVLLYMYGRSVIAVDMFLNVVTTNPDEVGELLGNMFPIMAAVVLIYLVPIIMGVVAVVRKWRLTERVQRMTRRVSFPVMAAGTMCFAGSFMCGNEYNPLTDLYPVNALYNVGIAVDRTVKMADYLETSAGYTFEAKSERPDSVPEVYVAVIGETSRADNWQLFGYGRATTPELMSEDGLVCFPRAISQSNTTHKAVPMLLSALDAETFGDSIYSAKGLLTAFKEAGFRTAFLSNQNRNHSFIDFFGEEADTCIFIRDYAAADEKNHYDKKLLDYLDRELKGGNRKLLVVLHTYGSHFNYYDRYPAEAALFHPDGPAEAVKTYRSEQINAYDNSVHATSQLLRSVMDRLRGMEARTALIYTSDHGEDIFDDSRNLFLHASPCPSYYQIHVPFMVWFSPRYMEAYPEVVPAAQANAQKFVASSKAYFHTLLDMAGLSARQLQESESVVNRAYKPAAPVYLNDHNRPVTLEEAGLLEADFARLDSIGISAR